LPVPRPVAAGYRRYGLGYRCDLITLRLANTHSLTQVLKSAALPEESWARVGAVIAQLHRNGVDHADLNAHNILLDDDARVSVIDFDRSRLRTSGGWQQGNLRRLHRSLLKVSRGFAPDRFSPMQWNWFMDAYRSAIACA
jgi:3-deoxy-D-manno-octulosonic acid kinase